MTEWRDIPGYEGRYQASDDGRIKSLARKYINVNGARRTTPECVLSAAAGGGRYLLVNLFTYGVGKSWKVHQLVTRTFHGPRPFPDAQVRHIDGDSFNNHAANLCWGTPAENMADLKRHGRNYQANKTYCVNRHEFTAENTLFYLRPDGITQRKCRACKRIWSRKYRAAAKAAKAQAAVAA